MKPALHCSQFEAGPHELILLCLIKLKWEFVFTEEVMMKTSSVWIFVNPENKSFGCFCIHCTHFWSQNHSLSVSDKLYDGKSYLQLILSDYLVGSLRCSSKSNLYWYWQLVLKTIWPCKCQIMCFCLHENNKTWIYAHCRVFPPCGVQPLQSVMTQPDSHSTLQTGHKTQPEQRAHIMS